MEGSELELATNDELIGELMRRETFRGLIAYQKDSYKGLPSQGWRWQASNCNPGAVVEGLLGQVPDNGTR